MGYFFFTTLFSNEDVNKILSILLSVFPEEDRLV